jgi:glycine/serine hydroxymethyltransferase
MGTSEMVRIADMIDRALRSAGDEAILEGVADDVRALCEEFPLYAGLRHGFAAA